VSAPSAKPLPGRPPDRLFVTVKAAVWQGERLLLVREDEGGGVHSYDLPGGRLDAGEAVDAGLERELREEIGAAIARKSALPAKVWATVNRDGVGVVALLYEVELVSTRVELGGSAEVLAAEYLTLAELLAFRGSVHKPFIAEYFRERCARD
jgi:ADP-ribose pyrophosphatase YjhB (NUDIX family)